MLKLEKDQIDDLNFHYKEQLIPDWNKYEEVVPGVFFKEIKKLFKDNNRNVHRLIQKPTPIQPMPTKTPPPRFIKDTTHGQYIQILDTWNAINDNLVN